MRQSISRDLHRYWDGLRTGTAAPERSDIDPVAIRHVLAFTFMLEITAATPPDERHLTFRLSGTRLDAVFQRGLKGRPFRDIWGDADLGAAEAAVAAALDHDSAVVATVRGAPLDRSAVDFEMLLLPLRHEGRRGTRILGSMASGTLPSWIGLMPVAALEMRGSRVMPRPSQGPARVPLRPAAGLRPVRASDDARQIGRFTVHDGGLA